MCGSSVEAYKVVVAVLLLTSSVCQSADLPQSNDSNVDNSSDSHPTDHTDTHEEHRYKVAVVNFNYVASPFLISAVVLCASLAKIGFHLNNKLSSVFPESCLLIVIGVVVGLILFFSDVEGYEMRSQTFFLFLLPPIVLEAGYFMPTRSFFDNLGTILLFAVVGTLFNTLMIGLTLWGLSQTSAFQTGQISVLHCLVFSSLLSAVDPVAVLAVFEEIHVNEVLHIVVFGESLLNDAVTVVLYHMFETYSEIGEADILAVDVVSGVFSFVLVAVCGTLIGVIFGFLTAFMSRFTDHVRVIEPLLVFVMGYLSYLTAEIFHFSGILACVFCGMTMKKYVEKNISQKSHTTIKYFMKMLASTCETIIFMYLGISTVSRYHEWESGFVLLTLIACLVYRAIGVVSLSALANRFRLVKLSFVDQFIMAYGGLRGAIAFSLVVLLDEDTFPERNLFITTSVVVIYFTVFIQGTTIKPLVNVLRVKKADKRKPSMNEKINERLVDHLMAGIEDMIGHHGHHEIRERYEYFDTKYIKPLLVREKQHIARGRSILNVYQKLAEKDAHEHLSKNGSFILNDLSRPSSFAQFLSVYNSRSQNASASCLSLSNACSLYYLLIALRNSPAPSIPMPDHLSSTCLDMRAFDGQSEQPMVHLTGSNIHHLLDDNMFTPRKTFTRHTRHMLPMSSNHPAFHHNARLHLRKLLSHPHKHKHRRPSAPHLKALNPQTPADRPRKNVSFVDQVTIRIEEPTPPGKMAAKQTQDPNMEEESGSETGITFTVGPAYEDVDSPVIPPLSPTVAETTLPWRCASSSPPMSSRRHSLANLLDALQEQLPPWITEERRDEETPLITSHTAPSGLGSVNYAGPGDEPHTAEDPSEDTLVQAPTQEDQSTSGQLDRTMVTPSSDQHDSTLVTPSSDQHDRTLVTSPSDQTTPACEGALPFPWKTETEEATPSYQPLHQSNSYQLRPLAPEDPPCPDESQSDSPLPPPWRFNSAPVLQTPDPEDTDSMEAYPRLDSPIRTEVELDSSEDEHVIPAPWRKNGSVSSTSETPGHTLPWRQVVSSPQPVIRTTSVAATLDSLYPHPSTHSFRVSEAESHHSQHLHHMHHLIDPLTLHPPHHAHEDTRSELQLEQVDIDEFVSNWILTLDPDLSLPVHDPDICTEASSQSMEQNTVHHTKPALRVNNHKLEQELDCIQISGVCVDETSDGSTEL